LLQQGWLDQQSQNITFPMQIQVKVQTCWRCAAGSVQQARCWGDTRASLAGDLERSFPGLRKHCIPATTCEPEQRMSCWFAVLCDEGEGCQRQIKEAELALFWLCTLPASLFEHTEGCALDGGN
jgi:hypothetical protein